MGATKVFLREKKISKGRKSLYLDFYPAIINPKTGEKTRREFLGMYIFEKPNNPLDRQHNKDVLNLARAVMAQRQIAIQNEHFGFASKAKRNVDFLKYFDKLARTKSNSIGNYGNWKSAYKHLSEFRPRGIKVEHIDKDFLESFKSYLHSKENLRQNSKVSYYQKLSAALKQAVRDGLLLENPTKFVNPIKPEETEREFLTLDEIKLLIKEPCEDEVYKSAFLFGIFTGLRFGDIKKLKWRDIQQSENQGTFIRFKQKKTKGFETLPLPHWALNFIGEPGPPDTLIFQRLEYSAHKNKRLKDWVINAGIDKHITFHCARHSYATLQLTIGTDLYTVSKLLGHKNLKTTQIYGKIIDHKKAEAVNKLNEIDFKV